jgi:RNA polymerase sigma-B factor
VDEAVAVTGHVSSADVERSIPRGTSPDSIDRQPAVDPDVWRDHLRYARTRDPDALNRLVTEYAQYARSLARRMRRGYEELDDLDQIALEGLVVSLGRFDPERGIPFCAFATPTILGSLRRHVRDHGWLVRVPRRVHELATSIRDATAKLTVDLSRSPTTEELAAAVGVDVDTLLDVQDALHARDARSLDHAVGGESLGDLVGHDDPALDHLVDKVAAERAIATLGDDDREILDLYYGQGLTQSVVAARIGVCQMQVSRRLASILARLRTLAADPAVPVG